MWQWLSIYLPVKKIVALLMNRPLFWTLLVFAVYIQTGWHTAAMAQNQVGYTRISSVIEGWGKKSITLQTETPVSIPRPIIRFLPGENGDTILVADFYGLLWSMPTKVVEVNSSFASSLPVTTGSAAKRGIKLVRVGKFQEMPPICRVAIISSDPEKLKTISFDSKPGKLTIKWSGGPVTGRNNRSPLMVAPDYRERNQGNDIREIATAPPLAPPMSALDPHTMLKPPIGEHAPEAQKLGEKPNSAQSHAQGTTNKGILSRWYKKVKNTYQNLTDQETASVPSTASTTSTAQKEPAKIPQERATPRGNPPTIALKEKGDSGFAIEIKSDSPEKLLYKTFRLSNPERYVIDFENLSEIADSALPSPTSAASGKFVRSMRVGSPLIGERPVGRLVLDLADTSTLITENKDNSTNTITIQVGGQENSLLAGLRAPAASTVILDAGHGGTDPGAQRGDTDEKDITLAIVKKTDRYLKASGVKVLLTRSEDKTVSLAERVELTNNTRPDAFLSVHINSLESKSDIHGIETYYQTPQSERMAKLIHKSLVDGLKAPDRSVRKAKFYVVNRTTVPAVLAEVGFISHKEEKKRLTTDAYQEKVAAALARGVVLYLRENNMVATNPQPKSQDEEVKSGREGNPKSNLRNSEKKQGNISSLSRLAQKGLGI
ncbi:AMIN domain-containing protein [bacterium]|nr:AMIN domain-containing protein [bacterium]